MPAWIQEQSANCFVDAPFLGDAKISHYPVRVRCVCVCVVRTPVNEFHQPEKKALTSQPFWSVTQTCSCRSQTLTLVPHPFYEQRKMKKRTHWMCVLMCGECMGGGAGHFLKSSKRIPFRLERTILKCTYLLFFFLLTKNRFLFISL